MPFSVPLAIAAAESVSVPPLAATQPTTFTFGTVYPAYASASGVECNVIPAPTAIYAPVSGNKVLMTFVEVDDMDTSGQSPGTGDVGQGVATLSFTSPTSGTLVFESFYGNLNPKPKITFSNYAATDTAKSGTLSVAFSMSFGGTCTLAVKAIYDNKKLPYKYSKLSTFSHKRYGNINEA
jgi:hypothetical protein